MVERVRIAPHVLFTLSVAGLGSACFILFAFPASVVLHFSLRMERGLLPLLDASQTVPPMALAQLMIVWSGIELLPKILPVIPVPLFPILVSFLSGCAQVPQVYLDLLASMRARRWRAFRRATLPATLVEYAGARRGLGVCILTAKNSFRADLVLAAVVISAGLTLSLLEALRLAARATAPGGSDAAR